MALLNEGKVVLRVQYKHGLYVGWRIMKFTERGGWTPFELDTALHITPQICKAEIEKWVSLDPKRYVDDETIESDGNNDKTAGG